MKIDTKTKGALVMAALAMVFGAQEAGAIPLVPGTAVTPTTSPAPSSAVIGSTSDTFSTGGGLGLMKGHCYNHSLCSGFSL